MEELDILVFDATEPALDDPLPPPDVPPPPPAPPPPAQKFELEPTSKVFLLQLPFEKNGVVSVSRSVAGWRMMFCWPPGRLFSHSIWACPPLDVVEPVQRSIWYWRPLSQSLPTGLSDHFPLSYFWRRAGLTALLAVVIIARILLQPGQVHDVAYGEIALRCSGEGDGIVVCACSTG